VAQHGGSVEVESEEGQGTRFTLTFPISSDASECDSRSGNRLGIPI
jgi:signal transduction histidine kinase